jgi:hypothetical protein
MFFGCTRVMLEQERREVSAMLISNAVRLNSMAKLNDHIDLTNKSFTSCQATKVTSIWWQNSMNGSASTTSTDRMAPSKEIHLTKRSEISYNHCQRMSRQSPYVTLRGAELDLGIADCEIFDMAIPLV